MEKYDNYPIRHYQLAVNYAGPEDFDTARGAHEVLETEYMRQDTQKPVPTEEEIMDILKLMGKTSLDDELNCGTCGYESCRDKAVAVFRGIADPSMCLPYIMEKNESFANNILNNSPNGLVIVNDQFEIQQLNLAAMSMLNIRSQSDVLGENIVRILDPDPFTRSVNPDAPSRISAPILRTIKSTLSRPSFMTRPHICSSAFSET